MQALVLVGGEGTRLRPLTTTIPKPIVPLVERPLIAYMVDWLAGHGVGEVVLAGGFRSEALREVLGEGGHDGPGLRYLAEPAPRGTAGAIKFAEPHLDERFVALNGDLLADLDLSALVRAHERHGARATLGLYPVEDPSAYGLVRTDEGGEIVEFVEKPPPGEGVEPGLISAGAYVLERALLEEIPPDRSVSIEREVFPRLVGRGLFGVRLDGYWTDVGTPARYLQASWDILEGRVRTVVEPRPDGVFVAPGATIADRARVGPRAVIGDGCQVRADVRVESSVLLRGCRLGEAARIAGSILGPGVEVAPAASLEDAVVGEGEKVSAS
jgi:mannose-1-phosphate guanylyltransferase